jgi:hypothetical protein
MPKIGLLLHVAFSSGMGMLFGWLFIRYGLVSARVAHFVVDLVQTVIPRLLAVTA